MGIDRRPNIWCVDRRLTYRDQEPMTKTSLLICSLLLTLPLLSKAAQLPIDGGESIFYERVGDGEEFIFVISHAYTFPALRALEDERWTIIAYDPRGRGRSSYFENDTNLGIEKDLQDINLLREHFGIEKINLLGFSFGGWIATAYASRFANRVNRLGLLAPGPVSFQHQYADPAHQREPFPPEADAIFDRLDALVSSGLNARNPQAYCYEERAFWLLIWSSGQKRSPDYLDFIQKLCRDEYLNEWPITRELRTAVEDADGNAIVTREDVFSADGFYQDLQAPTLILHGDKDRNSPIGGSRYWAWRLPDARLITVEGQAHSLHIEETERVSEAFRVFFSGSWPDDAERIDDSPLKQN